MGKESRRIPLDSKRRFFPSPPVGEGGASRSEATGEGSVSAGTELRGDRTPHPALRATFSHKGRREEATLLRLRHPWRGGGGDKTRGFQDRRAERGRDGHAERNQDPRARDRHEGDLDVALGGEISDHRAI